MSGRAKDNQNPATLVKRMKRTSKKEKAAPAGKPSQTEVPIPQALQLATKHHLAGNLSAAEKIYRAILDTKSDHPVALHLLGVISHQSGKHELAIDLISRAIQLQPNLAEACNNLGLAQQSMNRVREAVVSYRKAIAIKPDFVEALSNLGVSVQQLGDVEEAETCLRRALTLKPDFAEAHYNLGNVLRERRNPEGAARSYRDAIHTKPGHREAHNNLGSTLRELGRLDDAIDSFTSALNVSQDYAEAHNNLGNALRIKGKLEKAEASFRRALRINPDFAEAHNNLGATLHELKRLEEATNSYRKALRSDPEYAAAHNNLGNALRDLDNKDKALISYRRAIALRPDYVEARCNIGNVLRELGKSKEAIDNYRKVLNLHPDHADAHNGLGNALKEAGKLEEAEASYQDALRTRPDFAEAYTNLGMLQLLNGNYADGWNNYDWRRKLTQYRFRPRNYKKPLWDGGELTGATIFVHLEQGFGDCFQFARYIPTLVELGGKVILEAPRQTFSLLDAMNIADTIVTDDSALPPFDCHISLMDLPKLVGTTLDTIPSKTPYLTVPAKTKEKWEARLGPRQNFRLGIVWASNPENRKLLHKSIDLPLLAPIVRMPDITVYSLQVGRDGEAVKQFGGRITDVAPELTDFSETAGVISQLDLVVSVDTSVAHLTGALGYPVWTLVPLAGDWRWLLEREDSPWYSSMRLFRQTKRNDWKPVIGQLQTELTEAVQSSLQ